MQPADQRAFSHPSFRSFPAIPAVCMLLFALNLAIPTVDSASAMAPWMVLISAMFSSIAGFAFSPIAGAFLFHTIREPLAVVQILLVASIAQQFYCVWRLRENIRVRESAPYLVGSITTLPLGLLLLFKTPASTFLPLLGLLLVAYGVFSALRPLLRPGSNPLWGQVAAGVLGGITGGLAAFPAAFVTMWCHIQGFDKHHARSIIQPFILVNQLLSLGVVLVVKPAHVVPLSALRYAPPAVLGAYLGLMIFSRVDTSTFNRLVGVFLIFAGVSLARPF